MKVLFVAPLPPPTHGQSLASEVFLRGLTGEHQVDVIDLSKAELRAGLSSSSRVVEVLKILRAVSRKRKDADVIYLTVSESLAGNLKDLLIYLLCFGRLSRMVIHLHGGAGMKRIMAPNRRVLRRLNALFLRRLGGVIVLGRTHAEIFRGVVPGGRLHIVPNFAEDYLFASVERIDAKFAKTSPLKLLFLSNLIPGKGHDELVDAFFALDEQTRASMEVDFAGGFETEGQKDRFLGRIAGVSNIRYHGIVTGERKRVLFDQAHLFCLPTYYPYEGQPISILEAYASGCAVITTDHSGIRDVFRDEVNGFQVKERSATDLRRAIERAAAEPERLRGIATANLRTATVSYRTAGYRTALIAIIAAVGEGR